MQTHALVGAREYRKGQDQLWAHWQLQHPWLSVCSPVAAQCPQGMCMLMGASDENQAGSMQVHSWRS